MWDLVTWCEILCNDLILQLMGELNTVLSNSHNLSFNFCMQKIGQFKNAYLKFAFLLLINFHFKVAWIFETASFGISKETRIVISLNSVIDLKYRVHHWHQKFSSNNILQFQVKTLPDTSGWIFLTLKSSKFYKNFTINQSRH